MSRPVQTPLPLLTVREKISLTHMKSLRIIHECYRTIIMRNFILPAIATLAGCVTCETQSPSFSGGNGASHADSIVVRHGHNDAAVLAAERDWLRYRHNGAQIVERARELVGKPNHDSGVTKEYERLTFRTSSGETKVVYFDITDFVR